MVSGVATLAGVFVGLFAGVVSGIVGARFVVTTSRSYYWWWYGCVPVAAACAATVAVIAAGPVAPALAWFTAAAVALAVIDVRTLRLPNALVYPTVVFLAGWLSIAGFAAGAGSSALRPLAAGVAITGVYLALHIAAPAGLGMGDVKFAAAVGMAMGWYSWGWVAISFVLAFVAAALFAGPQLLVRARRRAIPFGPFMVLGAALTPVTAEPLTRWWLAW